MADLFSPILNPFIVVGIVVFKVFQKTFDDLTPGGKDGQTDHNKEYPLKEREEQTKNSQSNKEPTDDQNPNPFQFIHYWYSLIL